MPPRYQIHCIGKSDRLNHDQRIRDLGGVNPDGAHWKLSHEAAIVGIEAGKWSFYVIHAGRNFDIGVAVSKYGRKYLKTASDGLQPDSLLQLPECS